MHKDVDFRKYIIVFLITVAIFGTIFLVSYFLYSQRVEQVKNIEDSISRNILESDIQYALLADSLCGANAEGSNILTSDLNSLTNRLAYMEGQRGIDDPDVISLKESYSLLQVKDYLLLRERAKQCGENPPSILYFYSNKGDCADCKKIGYVLTSMREDFDKLHVYSFDYNIGLSVVETLKSIYKLKDNLPALVINRSVYYGFKTREEIEALIPGLVRSNATSTKSAK